MRGASTVMPSGTLMSWRVSGTKATAAAGGFTCAASKAVFAAAFSASLFAGSGVKTGAAGAGAGVALTRLVGGVGGVIAAGLVVAAGAGVAVGEEGGEFGCSLDVLIGVLRLHCDVALRVDRNQPG